MAGDYGHKPPLSYNSYLRVEELIDLPAVGRAEAVVDQADVVPADDFHPVIRPERGKLRRRISPADHQKIHPVRNCAGKIYI